MNVLRNIPRLSLAWLLLFGLAHCTEPCLELSNRVCSCEDSQGLQQLCSQTQKQAATNRPADNHEQETCEKHLDKDECKEQTICNNLDACGLTSPNATHE